jgi:hypothetical protein
LHNANYIRLNADLNSIYDNLNAWILKQGYTPDDGPCEVFLSEGPMTDYAQTKTKIMIPVKKLSQCKE